MNKDRLQMYESLTKITIVLCWLSLFSFWAIKIFGGNLFEIMVENQNFIKFSNLVQNTWVKYLVSFFTVFASNYLLFGAISQQFKFKIKEAIIVFVLIVSMWVVVNFVQIISVWYGYVVVIIYGIVRQKGWRKCFGLIGVALTLLFSTISMLVRNIDVGLVDNYLILLILVIDMYIMMALYYLYSNFIRLKKEIK
jgi:hypothetical protein